MQNSLLLAGLATSARTCEGVLVKVVLRSDQVTANAVTANAAIANAAIANAVTVIEVTVIEVILTEMTGTATEEAIVIAVVIPIRVTATLEVGLQRLRLCSSLLSHHLPFVGTTGTGGTVVGMLGPGTPICACCCQRILGHSYAGTMSRLALVLRLPTMTEVEVVTGTGARACHSLVL